MAGLAVAGLCHTFLKITDEVMELLLVVQEKQMSSSIRVRMKLHSVAGSYFIRSVDRDRHEGRYICVVSNSLGKKELPVNLTVLGTCTSTLPQYGRAVF